MTEMKYELWYANLRRTMLSERGQAFLRELLDEALDALPQKRLIPGVLRQGGEGCVRSERSDLSGVWT
jgi:hypothetical protein